MYTVFMGLASSVHASGGKYISQTLLSRIDPTVKTAKRISRYQSHFYIARTFPCMALVAFMNYALAK